MQPPRAPSTLGAPLLGGYSQVPGSHPISWLRVESLLPETGDFWEQTCLDEFCQEWWVLPRILCSLHALHPRVPGAHFLLHCPTSPTLRGHSLKWGWGHSPG